METITQKDIDFVHKKFRYKKDAKILSISHYGCMDGTVSTIPIYNTFNNVKYVKAKYSDVDEIFHGINPNDYDMIFATDISPTDKKLLDRYDNLILIDHHDSVLSYHEPSKMRFIYSGESASLLTQKFMTLFTEQDLSYLDELVKYSNDYDMWIHDYPQSKGMNELHFKYWSNNFLKRFKNGDTRLNEEEKQFLLNRKKELNSVYNNMDYWEMDSINGCIFSVTNFLNDICDLLLTEKKYKIVFNRNPKTKACSLRVKHEPLHIGNLLKELGFGGGHAQAGGFYEPDMVKFGDKIETIENEIYERFPELRIN